MLIVALISLAGLTASFIDFESIDVRLQEALMHMLNKEPVSDEEIKALPDFDGKNVVVKINENIPEFTEEENNTDLGGWQKFADLDRLNRVGAADAMLHRSMMPTEARGDISNVYPTGWNQKKLNNGVWLYNRSHLIGFQLTGENDNWKNLFTGTQELNQIYMVQFENEVGNYLRQTNNHVRYRVTPLFRERELLPRAVQIEGKSIEDEQINFNVLIHNVQEGISIDYTTGAATKKERIDETKKFKFR